MYEHEDLLFEMSFAIAKCARADRSLNDQDVIAALGAMAKGYETLVSSGLHYPAQPPSMKQQAITAEIQKTIAEYRELERKHMGSSILRDSDVLRALVFLLRMAYTRTSGRAKSRALIDSLHQQFPEKTSALVAPAEEANRIIVP